jgi:hypothetical protein
MKELVPQGIQVVNPTLAGKMRGLCVWVANKSLCLRARNETEFQGFELVRGKEAPQIFLQP